MENCDANTYLSTYAILSLCKISKSYVRWDTIYSLMLFLAKNWSKMENSHICHFYLLMAPDHHANFKLYKAVEVKVSNSSLNKRPFVRKITCSLVFTSRRTTVHRVV